MSEDKSEEQVVADFTAKVQKVQDLVEQLYVLILEKKHLDELRTHYRKRIDSLESENAELKAKLRK